MIHLNRKICCFVTKIRYDEFLTDLVENKKVDELTENSDENYLIWRFEIFWLKTNGGLNNLGISRIL